MFKDFRKQRKQNQQWWDEVSLIHTQPNSVYKIEDFKSGKLTLHNLEKQELGRVQGKTLLHLQCHIGLDTLSWSRLGAKVTGIDISGKAINFAKKITKELNFNSTFFQLDIFDIPYSKLINQQYDIVYTSYGILPWISHIQKWAEIIYSLTKRGGVFYIVDFHPFSYTIDVDEQFNVKITRKYFYENEPNCYKNEPDYVNTNYIAKNSIYTWNWNLGDVVTSLVNAGFKIVFLHEFDYSPEKCILNMKKNDLGYWYIPGMEKKVPLAFSIKALKQ